MIPRLVIFDCDGVLVDSEGPSNRVLSEAITEAGWTISYAETRARFIGLTIASVKKAVEDHIDRSLPEDWVADFDRRRNAVFMRDGVAAIQGVESVINLLRAQGMDFCVASSGKPEKMAVTLRLSGLERYFAGRIFSVTMVERPKPYPDLFLHAAASFGVAPADTIVIEDTVVGATAAVAAGMPVLGYAAESDAVALADVGAVVFDDMAQLPALLGLSREGSEHGVKPEGQ